MPIFRLTSHLYSRMIFGLGALSGAIFGLIAIFIGVDVIMRNTAGTGISWIVEFAEYAMYAATIFAAPWVLREGGHVSVDVLKATFPGKPAQVISILAALLGMVICGVIVYYSTIATWFAYQRSSMIYKSFTIPEWWVSVFIPLGMLLMTIEFALLASAELSRLSINNKTKA